jgi:hypothetical protein
MAATPKTATTVAGIILLVLATAAMVPTPAKADCVSACVVACKKYAEALCMGFNAASCTTPLPLGKTCEEVVIQPCGVSCLNGCTVGQLAGCII